MAYGDDIIGINGCGSTVLAMVVSGLTGDSSIYRPLYKVFKYAEKWILYEWSRYDFDINDERGGFGADVFEISLGKNTVCNLLKEKHPIICSMISVDFTTIGHFIVLTDIEDRQIKLHDLNSKINKQQ